MIRPLQPNVYSLAVIKQSLIHCVPEQASSIQNLATSAVIPQTSIILMILRDTVSIMYQVSSVCCMLFSTTSPSLLIEYGLLVVMVTLQAYKQLDLLDFILSNENLHK